MILNLSKTATLRTEESGHCREVAVVDRLKQESMYGCPLKKMAVVYIEVDGVKVAV